MCWGGGGFTNIFVIYLRGGGRDFFSSGIGEGGEGRKFSCPSRENLTGPPPGNR